MRPPVTRSEGISRELRGLFSLGVDADRFSQGVRRLRGLIVTDGQQLYTLFHPKLRDYLRQGTKHPQKDYIFALDEEQGWHKRLAVWCEQGRIESLWQEAIPLSREDDYMPDNIILAISTTHTNGNRSSRC